MTGGAETGFQRNTATAMAARAAESVDRARASTGQMALFDRPEPEAERVERTGKPGRPRGSRNRVKTDLAKLLAAHGYRDPASQLAHMAGLNSVEDPRLQAIAFAEALLQLAEDGDGDDLDRAERMVEEARSKGEREVALRNLVGALEAGRRRRAELPGLVVAIQREMRQAADALMPYVFGKVTPDQVQQLAQMVVQIGGPGSAPGAAEGADRRAGPPPMPEGQSLQNQGLSEG